MEKISTGDAPHYKWGADCDGWHLVKSEGLSVIQESVPAGCSEVMHYHQKSEQFFYVLSGIATLEVNSKVVTLKSNEGCHVPAKVSHQLRNEGTEVLNFIVISTPPNHGDRVEV